MSLSQLAETLIGSEIIKLAGEVNEKARQGHKIYNYTIGDFDPGLFPIPESFRDLIIDAYRNNFTNYPAADGIPELRKAVSAFVSHYQGLHYTPEEILISGGGRPLIYGVYRTLVDPGDQVIYTVPSWNNNHYTHFVDGKHIAIETKPENQFMLTADELKPHIEGARLLTLCSPLNPTGTTFRKAELKKICELVLEENRRRPAGAKKLFILYDQIYSMLCYNNHEHIDPVSLCPELRDYCVFTDGMSKAFAATGVRVGWAFGPKAVIGKMKSMLSHIGAWSPMPEQQAAAVYLMRFDEVDAYLAGIKARLLTRLESIHAGIASLKAKGYAVDSIAPEAAIYLTVKMDLTGKITPEGKALASQGDVFSYLLDAAAIALVPFAAFGAPTASPWYRLSVGTCKEDEIPAMLSGLENALACLS